MFALSLFLPISLSMAGVADSTPFRLRMWYYLSFATMLLAVVLTQSRGGLVGLTSILLFVLWGQRKARLSTLVVLGTLGIMAWLFLPVLMARFTGTEFWSGSGRLDLWEVGIQALKSHWIMGSGIGTFPFAYFEVVSLKGGGMRRGTVLEIDAHNLYLQLGVELGVIGVVLFAIALLTLLMRLLRIDRRSEHPLPCLSLQAALVGLLVGAFFSGVIRLKLFWLTVGLSMLMVVWSRSYSTVEGRVMPGREETMRARVPHRHEDRPARKSRGEEA
jgi:O-antigen ligase